MRIRAFLLLVFVALCASVQARLGWSKERMEKNYGEGVINYEGETEYQKQGLTVCVLYQKDRVVYIRYETGDDRSKATTTVTGERVGENTYRDLGVVTTYKKRQLTDEEIEGLMEVNGRKNKWLLRGRRKIQAREAEMGFDFDEGSVQEYVLDGGEARAFYTDQRTMLVFVMDEDMGRIWKYRKANVEKNGDRAGAAEGF